MISDEHKSGHFDEASGISYEKPVESGCDQTQETADGDMIKLVQELKAKQLELEIQNKELRQAAEELRRGEKRFRDITSS